MQLKDYFPSEEDQKRAESVLRRFGTQKKLNKAQQENLTMAKELAARIQTRNRVLAVAGFAGVSAILGVNLHANTKNDNMVPVAQIRSAGGTDSPRKNAQSMPVENEAEATIEQTDALIGAVEKGQENLERALIAGLKDEPDEALKKNLLAPFDLVRINKSNPNKNVARLNNRARRTGEIGVMQNNINYFSYHAGQEKYGIPNLAAFISPTRTMTLDPAISADNLIDMLVVHHELRHAMQDTGVRQQLDSKEKYELYLSFYTTSEGGRQKFLVLEEASAYAYEIEAMNALLGGALKETAKTGKPLDAAQVAQKLKAGPDQVKLVQMILDLGTAYYTSGSRVGGLSKSFLNTIYDDIMQHCAPSTCIGLERLTLGRDKPFVR